MRFARLAQSSVSLRMSGAIFFLVTVGGYKHSALSVTLTRRLIGHGVGPISASALTALKHPASPRTMTLDLCGNPIGDRGLQELAALKEASSCQALTLGFDFSWSPWFAGACCVERCTTGRPENCSVCGGGGGGVTWTPAEGGGGGWRNGVPCRTLCFV